MRYGEPSIRGALAAAVRAGRGAHPGAAALSRSTRLPRRGSALERVDAELDAAPEHPADRGAARVLRRRRLHRRLRRAGAAASSTSFRPDHVLFSYHGLPERQVQAADPTGSHCLADARLLRRHRARSTATATAPSASPPRAPSRPTSGSRRTQHATAFQSRLGRTPWIRPLHRPACCPSSPPRGRRRLAVLCPAFVADCLETLEEIGIRAREQWHELGGEELRLVPSLNAEPRLGRGRGA